MPVRPTGHFTRDGVTGSLTPLKDPGPFPVGRKVRCIQTAADAGKEGRIYTVRAYLEPPYDYLQLEELEIGWCHSSRFRLLGDDDIFALNGPLHREIDKIVMEDAVAFASRRAGGASASMNGALDYTAWKIIEAVRKHLTNATG